MKKIFSLLGITFCSMLCFIAFNSTDTYAMTTFERLKNLNVTDITTFESIVADNPNDLFVYNDTSSNYSQYYIYWVSDFDNLGMSVSDITFNDFSNDSDRDSYYRVSFNKSYVTVICYNSDGSYYYSGDGTSNKVYIMDSTTYLTHDLSYGGTTLAKKTFPVPTIAEVSTVEKIPEMIVQVGLIILPVGLVVLSMLLLPALIKRLTYYFLG